MNRRTVFKIIGIGGALAGLGAFMASDRILEHAVEKRILDELSFLKLDKDGVRRFVTDYTKKLKPRKKLALEYYSFAGISSARSRKINRLMNDYLLSTDFFINNMDESRTIKYIALNDPQEKPCINPFTNLYYPAKEA